LGKLFFYSWQSNLDTKKKMPPKAARPRPALKFYECRIADWCAEDRLQLASVLSLPLALPSARQCDYLSAYY